jgi:hypothetical protein
VYFAIQSKHRGLNLEGERTVPLLIRRRLLLALLLAFSLVVLLAAVALFPLAWGQNLKSRSARITVGMPREQVEEVLGPPVLTLPRTGGRGTALVWVDQFWQVDVLTGPDGRVESIGYMPSNSLYRRTVGRLLGLP